MRKNVKKVAARKPATKSKPKAKVKAKRKVKVPPLPEGRPTLYSPALADAICARVACAESMGSISRDMSMPCMSTLFKWLREIPEFSQQYEKAKVESADYMAEESLDIADNQVEQPLVVNGKPIISNGKVVMIKDAVSVAHARLRVDTRKWYASKLKPKKYGEKVTQEIGGIDGRPIETITSEMDAKQASEAYKRLIGVS